MLLIKALNFAAEKHKGQIRRVSGLSYIVHPMIVSELILKYKGTATHINDLRCVALLHDTLEDCECTYFELERKFNPLIASIVLELTSDEEQIKKVGKNIYLIDKMIKMSKYAFILKLVDRLSNVMDAPTNKYKQNTLIMCFELRKKRLDITNTQLRIIKEIEYYCNL